MPTSPKKLCPLHRVIHADGCPKCKATKRKDTRPSARRRGYDYRWEQASRRYRDEHPLCEKCLANNVVKASECVDHITPHEGNEQLMRSEVNWMALCWSCHSRKTRGETKAKYSK